MKNMSGSIRAMVSSGFTSPLCIIPGAMDDHRTVSGRNNRGADVSVFRDGLDCERDEAVVLQRPDGAGFNGKESSDCPAYTCPGTTPPQASAAYRAACSRTCNGGRSYHGPRSQVKSGCESAGMGRGERRGKGSDEVDATGVV